MLKPGDTAPPFDLPCAAGDRAGRLRLSQIDSEMVVLFFYPHDFSFICPTEVVGFHKSREAFAAEHHLPPTFIVAHAAAGDVRTIAAALGIRYRQLPDLSFSHSSVITLLDRDGVPAARTQVLAAEDPAFVASLRATLK